MTADETPCEGFYWIGQPFTSCDNCGRPFWEHTHDMQSGGSPLAPLVPVPITDEQRDAVKAKWDR